MGSILEVVVVETVHAECRDKFPIWVPDCSKLIIAEDEKMTVCNYDDLVYTCEKRPGRCLFA